MNLPVPVMALLGVLLAGCTVERATVTPEGSLAVLGPFPGFSPLRLPGDWALESDGDLNQQQLVMVTKQGLPALRVGNGEKPFMVVRRTRALLLPTPYLSWSWNIEPPSTSGFHPVRLVVGFQGGYPAGSSWTDQTLQWLGPRLPRHDRAISLTWGESALQRGALELPLETKGRAAPRYTVRGGRENAGTWWLETVDLAHLYSLAWPDDDAARVQIVFIGIAAPGGRAPAPAYISGILLSR